MIRRASIAICVAILALLCITGCEPVGDYFPEYRGVDLLENSGFETASWIPDQDSTYITYEQLGTEEAVVVGVPDGVDAGTPVFRLEVVNLMPNGDFEDTDVTAGALSETAVSTWWLDDPSEEGAASINTTDFVITGSRSLEFDLLPEDAVRFPLTGLSDGLVVPQSYYVRFAFLPTYAAPYSFVIDQERDDVPPWIVAITTETPRAYTFPDEFIDITSYFASVATSDEFHITGTLQHGAIDDVRVVPIGISLALRNELPISDATRPGELDLVSGTYKFSMYVRSDPSTALNRWNAEAITVRMRAERVSISQNSIETVFYAAESETGSWDSWTQLEVTLSNANIFAPEDPDDPVLTITITAVDDVSTGARDAGSLLITHPMLEHLPDG